VNFDHIYPNFFSVHVEVLSSIEPSMVERQVLKVQFQSTSLLSVPIFMTSISQWVSLIIYSITHQMTTNPLENSPVVVVVVGGLCTIMVLISKSMLVASNTIQDRIKMKKFNNDSFQKCYSF